MIGPTPISELTVAELLARWPQTAQVFQRYYMACVGCAVASFYSVADAVRIYGLELDRFLADLEEAIEDGER